MSLFMHYSFVVRCVAGNALKKTLVCGHNKPPDLFLLAVKSVWEEKAYFHASERGDLECTHLLDAGEVAAGFEVPCSDDAAAQRLGQRVGHPTPISRP